MWFRLSDPFCSAATSSLLESKGNFMQNTLLSVHIRHLLSSPIHEWLLRRYTETSIPRSSCLMTTAHMHTAVQCL